MKLDTLVMITLELRNYVWGFKNSVFAKWDTKSGKGWAVKQSSTFYLGVKSKGKNGFQKHFCLTYSSHNWVR